MQVKRAYKLCAYPTRAQEGRAVGLLRDHCDLYNAALQERREAWRMQQVSVSYGDQSAQLREIRAADPDGQGRHSFTAQQQHRQVVGRVKTLQLKREYRRWYVIVVVETEAEPLPPTGRAVGVDVGVVRFLTTSDGEVVANPRFLDTAQVTLTDLQRRKDRAKPGSGNRKRLRRVLTKEWRKVRNRRRDFHHKTARALVDAYDALALEDLRVANMTASASGTIEAPGQTVAQKSGLNRAILDAGWGQFTAILTAKAESAGRRVILVNPAYTSIDCHACGTRCARSRQDTVVCPVCGPIDADVNGARNIATRAGLGSGQASAA